MNLRPRTPTLLNSENANPTTSLTSNLQTPAASQAVRQAKVAREERLRKQAARQRALRAERKAAEGGKAAEEKREGGGAADLEMGEIVGSDTAAIQYGIHQIQKKIDALDSYKEELREKERMWEEVEMAWILAQERYGRKEISEMEWRLAGTEWYGAGIEALSVLREKREREGKLQDDIEKSFITQARVIQAGREVDDGPVGSILEGFEDLSEYSGSLRLGLKSDARTEMERRVLMDTLCVFWVDGYGRKAEEFQELVEKEMKK